MYVQTAEKANESSRRHQLQFFLTIIKIRTNKPERDYYSTRIWEIHAERLAKQQ